MLAAYPLSRFATPEVIRSTVAGGIMNYVNLLLGYGVIELSFTKSHTTFLKCVLGGMLVRLMLMWGVLILLLKVFAFHSASLMFSLLVMYGVNLVLEIWFLQKKVETKSRAIQQ